MEAYVPLVVRERLRADGIPHLPFSQDLETAVMFGDVSGFTKLSEHLASSLGVAGAAQLAHHLNGYLSQLIRLIARSGGDVFCFAGDAVLVLWPPGDDSLAVLAARAARCALEVQSELHEAELARGIVLSIKLGLGAGAVTATHLGGVQDGDVPQRIQTILTGAPVLQAFGSEEHCSSGDVVVSPELWALVQDNARGEAISEGFMHLLEVANTGRRQNLLAQQDSMLSIADEEQLWCYVPRAIATFLDLDEEPWAQELRHVTVMFISMGLSRDDLQELSSHDGLEQVHLLFRAVQTAIYSFGGTINKLLVDDKGCTCVAVFGLAPLAHNDDPTRAVLAALAVVQGVGALGRAASVGVTSGTVFCGVAGHYGSRREFTVLGDTVNLSARLMQHGIYGGGGKVFCDASTAYLARHQIAFVALEPIRVKGKSKLVPVHRPEASPDSQIRRELFKRSASAQAQQEAQQQQQQQQQPQEGESATPRSRKRVTASRSSITLAVEAATESGITVADSLDDEGPNVREAREKLTEVAEGALRAGTSVAVHVRGELGIGKTRLLLSVFGNANGRFGNAPVVSTAGSSFQRRPLAVLASLVKEAWVVSHRGRSLQDTVYRMGASRGQVPNELLELLAGEEAAEASSEEDSETEGFLLELLQQSLPLVALVDDAAHLDARSWALLDRAADTLSPLVLVVATRSGRGTVLPRGGVLDRPDTLTMALRPLPPLQMLVVAQRLLGVESFPEALMQFLDQKCRGNPLFLREVIEALVADKLLVVQTDAEGRNVAQLTVNNLWDDDRSVSDCFKCHRPFTAIRRRHHCRRCGHIFCGACAPDTFKKLAPGYTEPQRHCGDCYQLQTGELLGEGDLDKLAHVLVPPITVQRAVAEWLDQITLPQLLALKVACVIGPVFHVELLQGSFPLAAHVDRIPDMLTELEALGFVNATDDRRNKFEFSLGFLADVLRARMLSSQRAKLYSKVNECREAFDAKLRAQFFDRAGQLSGTSLKEGWVLVKKHSSRLGSIGSAIRSTQQRTQWKRRKATVLSDRIVFGQEEGAADSAASAEETETFIFLHHARIAEIDSTIAGRDFCFQIIADRWSKRGEEQTSRRPFVVCTEDPRELQDWVFLLKYAIETVDLDDAASALPDLRRRYSSGASVSSERSSGRLAVVTEAERAAAVAALEEEEEEVVEDPLELGDAMAEETVNVDEACPSSQIVEEAFAAASEAAALHRRRSRPRSVASEGADAPAAAAPEKRLSGSRPPMLPFTLPAPKPRLPATHPPTRPKSPVPPPRLPPKPTIPPPAVPTAPPLPPRDGPVPPLPPR